MTGVKEHIYKLQEKFSKTYEKESILRTLGADGISINNEFEKNDIRLRASKLDGTSMADSFTVSSKYNLLICRKKWKAVNKSHQSRVISCNKLHTTTFTFSFQASESGVGNLMAPVDANN